ncbi:hypothetical protein PHMEG_00038257 [Phytophthora megakarya]|uniref:Uncharacterized protein n=1 Tax=Phytophthora megakarya TaxID=4795 RepID=A0A225UI64_9STRA|nr:hypothetical protein PHMEG_00038257 [Phytophthora megakarya]
MRISLPRRYDVSASGPDTKSQILKIGLEAESNLIGFLNGQGIKAKAIRTVVKALKRLLAQGNLNEHIMA